MGGSVRDFLLEKETKDLDLATDATPQVLCQLFPEAIPVGKAFGVIKVPTGTYPPLLEIATFRQDLEYEDHRRPKGVIFSGPKEDAFRRDFTINALFFDPKANQILDPTGKGLDDLDAKVLRAIGDPTKRLREDALRLIRAVRFKTKLDFKLEPDTTSAIQANAKLILKVSAERIRDELTQIWISPRPAEALEFLSELGLLSYILPEVEALKKAPQALGTRRQQMVWAHVLKTLSYLAEQNPVRSSVLSWVAVLHEVGRLGPFEQAGGKELIAHDIQGAKISQQITARLKMPSAETNQIAFMIENHLKFREVFQMREATLQRFIRQPNFDELLAFHKADAMATDGNLAYYEFAEYRLNERKKTQHLELQKLISGEDLIQLGFNPGPLFSKILGAIEDLTLEGELKSKEQALEYVFKNFVK